MNTERFETEERRRGVRKSLTEKAIKEVERLEAYLACCSRSLETATLTDVVEYLRERTMSTVATLDVHGLGRFLAHLGNDRVVEAIPRLRLLYTTPLKLGGFLDVDSSDIVALERAGIRTNSQLLRRAATAEARKQLAQDLGIPEHAVEKLTKLSDLARIRGVKGIRSKLYYDMGIRTVKQMAQWTPDELVRAAKEHVERSCFEGIATLPKEARFTVDLASRLPAIADFS